MSDDVGVTEPSAILVERDKTPSPPPPITCEEVEILEKRLSASAPVVRATTPPPPKDLDENMSHLTIENSQLFAAPYPIQNQSMSNIDLSNRIKQEHHHHPTHKQSHRKASLKMSDSVPAPKSEGDMSDSASDLGSTSLSSLSPLPGHMAPITNQSRSTSFNAEVTRRVKKEEPAQPRPTSMFPIGTDFPAGGLEGFDSNTLELIKDRINLVICQGDPEERYCVLERLGSGAQAEIFAARDRKTAHLYALKKMKFTQATYKHALDEAELLATLRNAYCIHSYCTYYKDRHLWIFMEYCQAGSLVDHVEKEGEEALTESVITVIISQTLMGLAYIHARGLVHRDIKAANLLLNEEGTIKIADFGIASSSDIDVEEIDNTIAGSAYWMAPEIIENIDMTRKFDPSCDIWSLGITIIELCEKVPPLFDLKPITALYRIAQDDSPKLKNTELKWSRQLVDFVNCCLDKDPAQRPSAADLLGHRLLERCPGDKILKNYVNGIYSSEALQKEEPLSLRRPKSVNRLKTTRKKDVIRMIMPVGPSIFITVEKNMTVRDAIVLSLEDTSKQVNQSFVDGCEIYMDNGRKGKVLQSDQLISNVIRAIGMEKRGNKRKTIKQRVELESQNGFHLKPKRPSERRIEQFWSVVPSLGCTKEITVETTKELIACITEKPFTVAHCLLRVTGLSNPSPLHLPIVQIMESTKSLLPLIMNVASFEISTIKDPKLFLIRESLGGHLVTDLIKFKCADWIKLVFAPALPQILVIKQRIVLDKTIADDYNKKHRKQNVKVIGNLLSTIISSMISNFDRLPKEIKELCVSMENLSRKKLNAKPGTAMKTILFERLLIQTLLTPQEFGIIFDIPDFGRWALYTLSVIVQAIVDREPFTKAYMDKMNTYVESLGASLDDSMMEAYDCFVSGSSHTPIRPRKINVESNCIDTMNLIVKNRPLLRMQLG